MRSVAQITLAASLAGALLLTGGSTTAGARDASRLQSVTYDVGTRSERRDTVERKFSPRARDLGRRIGRPGHKPQDIREAFELPSARKIFGGDDREPVSDTDVYPWTTVAKVYSTFPDGLSVTGSAVLVGESQALTAGHVVYDDRHGGWATDVEVIPGFDLGFAPFGSVYADEIRSFTGWIDDRDFAYDFALLDLDDTIGDLTGWMGLAARDDADLFDNLLNTAGYPTDLDDGEGMWYAADFAESIEPTAINLRGTFDAAQGQSGSGVWLRENDDRIVVGVVSTETRNHNVAARVTGDIFDVLDAWLDGFEGPADLSPIAVTTDLPFDVSEGDSGTVSCEIDNFGLRPATVEAEAFLHDASGDRHRMGSTFVTIGADDFEAVDIASVVPAGVPEGLYTIVVVVNADGTAPESDSSNNEAEGPDVSVTPATGGGGGGDYYEPLTLPAKVSGRLEANAVVRYRFDVTDPSQKIKFRLRGRNYLGFALVVRPDGSTFKLLRRTGHATVESQPQVGRWLVLVKQRYDAGRSRRFKLRIKIPPKKR